jgi:hypothetical protein
MTLEMVLLILESVLLVVTIILLLFSLKEGRGRRSLLLEVGKATKILTRQEYFLSVTDSMMDAATEVVGVITGRLPSEEDKKRVSEIVAHIEKLKKEGITAKYLIPKFHDRLHIGHLYRKAGAEVRFSICAIANNIRYIIADDRVVVIGIPESTGEKEATRKGYRIPSEGLAAILKDHFSRCWEESTSYNDYLKEIIRETGATSGLLAKELQIDEREIEKFISR